MAIEVRGDLPLPLRRISGPRASRWPFDKLVNITLPENPGDSFSFDYEEEGFESPQEARRKVGFSASAYATRHNNAQPSNKIAFAVRVLSDNRTIAVWRVPHVGRA